METQPVPLDARHDGLDAFRVTSPAEIVALLRQLADGNVLVTLGAPAGGGYVTTVWALEPARGLLCLNADAGDPKLQGLLESDEVVAVGYLDNIKLQFDLHDLVLVHSGRHSALNARFPREIYRFQRRNGFRVKPLLGSSPTATLPLPGAAGQRLSLRVLDVSIGGVALLLPDDAPRIEPGWHLEQVLVELDGDTRLLVGLQIHHLTQLHHGAGGGARLGCEIVGVSGPDARALQRYIDQTQKRRRLLSL